jgi:protein phosphatase
MLDLEFAQCTDPGRVRGHNEDFMGYAEPATSDEVRARGWVFVLADGVGGHDKGEVASRTAVESILKGFRAAVAGESHGSVLTRLIQTANVEIYEAGAHGALDGPQMATTVVACALRYDRLAVAHVGDSRCYVLRSGRAHALTRDHTVVNDQVRLGLLSAKEAAESGSRHLLSRSVGNNLFVNVDISEHQVHTGDIVLLCSDGLHGAVDPSQMTTTVEQTPDLAAAARKLVAFAYDRDGSDNISVQLIRVRNVERVGMYRGRPYKLQ